MSEHVPDAAEIAQLRLVGVYDDRQPGWFMVRVRIPGGELIADQLETVAGVLRDFGARPPRPATEPPALWDETPQHTAEITTRQDLQLHWIRHADLRAIWDRFDAVGLTTLQACGDTLRNVTACPVAGVDAHEIVDTRPIVAAISRLAVDEPKLTSGLPRKFKVAVTGCPSDCVAARLHDLAFTPARRDGVLGFNVHVGGGLSDYPRLASALELFVRPEQVVDTVRGTLRLFRERGDAAHKAVNRFRMLVHQMGTQTLTGELRRRVPLDPEGAGTELSSWQPEDHLGVRAARDGTSYVGLSVPLARLTAAEFVELARLARHYGNGGVRLTQRQNLVLTGVTDPVALQAEPLLQRLRPDPDVFDRAVLACTGAPFCKFGVINSKAVAGQLVDDLRERVSPDAQQRLRGLRIHVSGCKASCAQTHAAHLGLRGTTALHDGAHLSAVDIAAGGDVAAGRLARWVRPELPLAEVAGALAAVLEAAPDAVAISDELVRDILTGASSHAG